MQIPNTKSLVVLQQSAFTFECAKMCYILGHFERAKISAFGIAYCKIADIDELALEIDPEFGHVALPAAKVVQNFLHHVHACRRVAILDFPAKDGFCAFENLVRTVGEISHAVVGIDEG